MRSLGSDCTEFEEEEGGEEWGEGGLAGSAPGWLRVNKRGRNNFAFGISTAE